MFRSILFALSFLVFSTVFAAPVNINTASAEEIATSLSGVGVVKSEAIVDYRKEHGNFYSVEDLVNVKGIGAKTLEKNKDNIIILDKKIK